jgi:ABC-type transport system substrate-binding protein
LRMSLQSNVLDMVSDLQLSDSNLSKEGIVFHTKVISTECVVPDTINPDSPWSNKKFREAIEYGIDKESIAKAFGYGYLQAPYQMPPPDSLAFNPDFTLGRKYDPEKAKQLLSESGLTMPIQTTFIVSQVDTQSRALAMQDSLAKIGVNVKLDFPDFGRWMTYLMGPWPKNSALFTPYPTIDPTYSLGLQFIMTHISASWKPTPELTAAVQAAFSAREIDIAKIRAATDIVISDALLIPVKYAVNCQGDWPYVHYEYEKRGGPVLWNTETAWIDK